MRGRSAVPAIEHRASRVPPWRNQQPPRDRPRPVPAERVALDDRNSVAACLALKALAIYRGQNRRPSRTIDPVEPDPDSIIDRLQIIIRRATFGKPRWRTGACCKLNQAQCRQQLQSAPPLSWTRLAIRLAPPARDQCQIPDMQGPPALRAVNVGISAKTADRYCGIRIAKIGVSARAAATLFRDAASTGHRTTPNALYRSIQSEHGRAKAAVRSEVSARRQAVSRQPMRTESVRGRGAQRWSSRPALSPARGGTAA